MSEYVYINGPREELKAFLPNTYKKVLEIGCGTGGFRNSLNPEIEIWGIEPNLTASKEAMTKGYKILNGLYDDVENHCPDHYFDLIVCNDVIEHMIDHEVFLNKIKNKMTGNGCLVGSIPNMRYYPVLFKLLFNKDWEYTQDGVLDRTHLRFFTEKSLKRAFEKGNYIIEHFKGINADGKYWFTLKSTAKLLLIHFPFGLFKDTQYMQFGFRIRPK